VHFRKTGEAQVVVAGKEVVGVKYLEVDRSWIVATRSPTTVAVYSLKGGRLWEVGLGRI
jgi:hypothetical protein